MLVRLIIVVKPTTPSPSLVESLEAVTTVKNKYKKWECTFPHTETILHCSLQLSHIYIHFGTYDCQNEYKYEIALFHQELYCTQIYGHFYFFIDKTHKIKRWNGSVMSSIHLPCLGSVIQIVDIMYRILTIRGDVDDVRISNIVWRSESLQERWTAGRSQESIPRIDWVYVQNSMNGDNPLLSMSPDYWLYYPVRWLRVWENVSQWTENNNQKSAHRTQCMNSVSLASFMIGKGWQI